MTMLVWCRRHCCIDSPQSEPVIRVHGHRPAGGRCRGSQAGVATLSLAQRHTRPQGHLQLTRPTVVNSKVRRRHCIVLQERIWRTNCLQLCKVPCDVNLDLYGDACLAPGAAAASVGNGMLEEPVPNNVLLHFFHVFVKTLPRNVPAHVPSCMNTHLSLLSQG